MSGRVRRVRPFVRARLRPRIALQYHVVLFRTSWHDMVSFCLFFMKKNANPSTHSLLLPPKIRFEGDHLLPWWSGIFYFLLGEF